MECIGFGLKTTSVHSATLRVVLLASNTNWVYHKEKIQLSESIRLGPSVFDTGQKRCRESAVQRQLWTHADTPINLSEHKNSVQASYTENIQ